MHQNNKTMKTTFVPNVRGCMPLLFALLASLPVQSALIAGWDFQTTVTGGTAVAAQPNTQRSFNANFGSGTLSLDGTNGSSVWSLTNELNGFTGTGVNAGDGFSTITTGAGALGLIGGSGNAANGKRAVFIFSMAGFESLSISLAAQRTATGFSSQLWEYSADGVNYQGIGTLTSGSSAGSIAGTYSTSGILSFQPLSGLDNISTAYVRVTFDGATSATGNNRLDNIQFNASEIQILSSVPEPGCPMLVAVGAAVALSMRSRRSS
jgi:hypothetical protein